QEPSALARAIGGREQEDLVTGRHIFFSSYAGTAPHGTEAHERRSRADRRRGARDRRLEPHQSALPEAQVHEARSGALLPRRARREVATGARCGGGGPNHAARVRAHWLAENVRLARHARPRAHRTALDLRRSPPRGVGTGARRGAPRTYVRDEQMVEGRAPRRVRGL